VTWLVWRQHRRQLLFGLVGLAVIGSLFFATGKPMHDQFRAMGLADCLPQAIETTLVVDLFVLEESGEVVNTDQIDEATVAASRCAQTARAFYDQHQNVVFFGLLLLLLPLLAGMFWGAPLVANEIEHGTHRLVWTQGTSRLRWAATKIGLVSAAVLALTAIYALMLNWWITPVMQTSGQRFDYVFFDIHGFVVFGYAIFALALGFFAGAATGRLLPAMAITVVGFIGMWIAVMVGGRIRYLPLEDVQMAVGGPTEAGLSWNRLHGDWIRVGPVEVPGTAAGEVFQTLPMHPADRFVLFQGIETAIFVALAVILVVVGILLVRRRSA
jgi:hypothetical protein